MRDGLWLIIFFICIKEAKINSAKATVIELLRETQALSTPCRRNLKMQQSLVILDLCLKRTWSGKSRDYRDLIVFENLSFQNVFRPH